MAGSVPTELGVKPVNQLIRQYAVPGIIAMTASSLYNMVDSIYIGHIADVGSLAISGLAVTFPLMNISTAFGTLVGVGAATMISVLLGQKNYAVANKVLSNEVTLNIITGLVFTFVTLMWMDPILRFFGATEATLPFARQYMTVIALGNAVTHLYFGLNSVIRSSGNPKTAMGLTLFTVTSNAILDPIFIFALGMGIKGAAIATILCQLMALTYSFRFFLDRTRVPHFPKGLFKLDWRIARQSLAIGLGPFLMNAAACMVNLFVNQQLGKYGGDLAIGAYGIVNRITFMFVMIVMGLNQGLQPIAGYNYGARQYSRVKEIFMLTAKWAILTTTLCFLVSELIPGAAVGLFTNDPYLEGLAEKGLRTMNIMMPLVGVSMITTTFFQCLGMVNKSIFLSLSRQLIFLLPLLYLLPLKFQEKGIWMSFPISDGITIVISILFVAALFKKLSKLNDGDDPSILGSNIK